MSMNYAESDDRLIAMGKRHRKLHFKLNRFWDYDLKISRKPDQGDRKYYLEVIERGKTEGVIFKASEFCVALEHAHDYFFNKPMVIDCDK